MADIEKSIADIDLAALSADRTYTPSPPAWEDEVLYFLMLDRFSDGNETGYIGNDGKKVTTGGTPLYTPADNGNALDNATAWENAGADWVGAKPGKPGTTIAGLESKLGYLKRLGITAIWISPLFRQVAWGDTYHGYGVQNFLDVDPRFGTREELKQLVETAHEMGMRVILDIIINHGGDVFAYDTSSNPNRYPPLEGDQHYDADGTGVDPRWDGGTYPPDGFRGAESTDRLSFEPGAANPEGWPNGAVWPAELQEPGTFTRMGRIRNFDHYPEYLEGDFFSLKEIDLGAGPADDYHPSNALIAICEAYKFWIAWADVDGFRVDTVKHMDKGAARYMTSALHEFAQSIGKDNFYLIGEITGGRDKAVEDMEAIGLDAALGINDVMHRMENLVKGMAHPEDYFGLFRNAEHVGQGSHTWFRDRVVTMFDDHDQVGQKPKRRFCAPEEPNTASPHPDWEKLAPAAMALNVTTLGIPCIYYGSEQGFDGKGGNDRYIREAMYGGAFGAFRTKDRHFFDEDHPIYGIVADVLNLRADPAHMALRRGRQYLRQISGNGIDFGYPHMMGSGPMHSVVPWSRIFNDREYLLAINTDPGQPRTAWVVVDADLNAPGSALTCIYSTAEGVAGSAEVIKDAPSGGRMVQLTVPPAGFVVYRQG